MGFSQEENTIGTCIYCASERAFFQNEFGLHDKILYIYETPLSDQSVWRRGLMHSNKEKIRDIFETCDGEVNDRSNEIIPGSDQDQ
jgi:hypothetical protein